MAIFHLSMIDIFVFDWPQNLRYLILRIQSWHFYLASCSMLQNLLLQKKNKLRFQCPTKHVVIGLRAKIREPWPTSSLKTCPKILIFPTKTTNNGSYLVSSTRHYHLRSIFQYFPAPKHPFGMCQTHQFCRLLIINFEGGGHIWGTHYYHVSFFVCFISLLVKE